MTRAVGGMAGAPDRFACLVVGVTAKRSLRDAPFGRAVKGQSHVLEFEHRVDGFIGHELDGILVAEIIRTFDRVIGVPFRLVFFIIAKRRTDAALRRARMGTRRIELADHSRLCAARGIQTCHQPRAPRADDYYFKLMNICHEILLIHHEGHKGTQRFSLRDPLCSFVVEDLRSPEYIQTDETHRDHHDDAQDADDLSPTRGDNVIIRDHDQSMHTMCHRHKQQRAGSQPPERCGPGCQVRDIGALHMGDCWA